MMDFRSPLRDALPPIDPDHIPAPMRPHIEAIRRAGRARRVAGFLIGTLFYGSLLVLAVFIAWVFASATDRDPPTLTTVEIATPAVSPGSDLRMRVSPHLLKICEGKVVFRAYDRLGNIINQSETAWAFPLSQVGIDKTFIRPIRISRDAVVSRGRPDGTLEPDARMRIERKFYCNAVQKVLQWPIVEVTPDMPFAIAPGPER